MAREIAITFALNAALKGGFTAAFQGAASSARGVASAIREMERSPTGKLGATIAAQRDKIKGLSGSLKDARATLATLKQQAESAGGASGILARQIAQVETRVNSLSGALKGQLRLWRENMASAATAAGSVRRMSADYADLCGRMEQAKKLAGSIHASQARGDALRAQRADLQGRLLSTTATAATFAMPVKLAISAEDTFADLRKVMDVPEDVMRQVFADAQAMSTQTGKSFEDVVAIMTAAAQAGLGKTREELLGVAGQAVKMSIAWGVSAEDAGKSMATWQAAMGLTARQARDTGDVINALSNEMNAEAGEINEIFTRMGPMLASSGMATRDIAAIATAFKAAGAQVEVSGTAMKNFTNVMVAGNAGLVDSKKSIMKFLRIDPDELQKQFYTDAKGAILRVLEALKDVNPEERGSIAAGLFGQESIAAISPLLKNLDLLKQSFKIANGDVTGSVDEEYANRMKTTATAISQMTQSVRNLGVNAGKTLLPVVGAVARGITWVAGAASSLVERFPRLSSVSMTAGASIAALAVGGLALGLVINTMRSAVNSVGGAFLRMAASQAMATASTGALTATSLAFGGASRVAGAGARFFAGGLRAILTATGVGALLVAIGFGLNLLIDNWDAVSAAMSSAWGWLTDTWGRLGIFFTELGNNLIAVFPSIWEGICGLAASARDTVVSIWQGITGFFSTLWNGITEGASYVWQNIVSFATWAFDGVASVWSGITGFFSGIVDGISGIFAGFFDCLRNNFSWVFSAIDAVSGFIGKITGAVSGAWNKAFGDGGKDDSAAPVARNASENPVAKVPGPSAPNAAMPVAQGAIYQQASGKPRLGSFSDFRKNQGVAGKTGTSSAGGGGHKSSGSGFSRAGSGSSSGNGPVTIVSLAGDNSRPQTIFIPASGDPAGKQPVAMPAVKAASASSSSPRALPQTPAMIARTMNSGKKTSQAQSSINIDFTQQFDLIAQDAAAVRKVMEALKPDFESLVRRALEKMQSDKRRTAYAQ